MKTNIIPFGLNIFIKINAVAHRTPHSSIFTSCSHTQQPCDMKTLDLFLGVCAHVQM